MLQIAPLPEEELGKLVPAGGSGQALTRIVQGRRFAAPDRSGHFSQLAPPWASFSAMNRQNLRARISLAGELFEGRSGDVVSLRLEILPRAGQKLLLQLETGPKMTRSSRNARPDRPAATGRLSRGVPG